MSWFSQNWIWVVLAIGVLFLMTRRGTLGCGTGHHGQHAREGAEAASADAGAAGPGRQAEQRQGQQRGRGHC